MDGPVERRRCWRSTSSGSSRSLYVPLALSGHATGSSEHSCASVSCTLTSFALRAGQSSPRWHSLPFSSRKLVSSLAGRLPTAPVDARRASSGSSRTQAVQKARLGVPTRPGGRAPRAVRDGSYRGRTRPHVPLRAAGALWCVARTDTAPVARPCARPPLKNRRRLRTLSQLLSLDLAWLRPSACARSNEDVSAVQSSASPDPVSPVERELDRFLGLLKSDERARCERSCCRRCSSQACSLGLVARALSEASRADACGRRHRARRPAEQS